MTQALPAGSSIAPAAPPLARVLVADDDPASRRFLHDALHALGARATDAADGGQALALAEREAFDLLLLDCRMPGAGALQVLAALRQRSGAASRDAFAVATSAELSPPDRARLLAAGFGDVLPKPCGLQDVQRILLRLPRQARRRRPLLDDAAALMASGDATTMAALRQLLQHELAALAKELDRLGTQRDDLRDRLHRLRSSCGFCGATALADEVVALQRQLADQPVGDHQPLRLFPLRTLIEQTIAALGEGQPPSP